MKKSDFSRSSHSQALIEDSSAQIAEAEGKISDLGAELAAKGQELDSATAVRKNENTDFVANEKELVEAVDTLSRAVVIIKREMSFAQGRTREDKSEGYEGRQIGVRDMREDKSE